MNDGTQDCVILTDNGVEFENPNALEHTRPRLIRTHVFFCDPQASWQKPHVENNLSPIPPDEVILSPKLMKH